MKIKHRFSDFRVTEVLRPGLVQKKGPYSVYRVTKRKLSTREAVEELAHLCGCEPSDVSVAGLKDRQGITIQHMTVPGRKPLKTKRPDLRIEHIGFAQDELSSKDSEGNSFEITVRAVEHHELAIFKKNIAPVREFGVPNYFDEQRFGNLRHGQGWIARDLMLGEYEQGLKSLLSAPSPFDDERNKAFKSALHRNWGDWRGCRDVAGRFGAHHSIFEHLGANPDDFAGAFFRVATRLRLIHLYAFQSHIWNRAVAERIREVVDSNARIRVPSVEGPLVFYDGEPPLKLVDGGIPLPGASLEGVEDEATRELFARVLQAEGLTVENFRIDGVPGFQLKPEERPLIVLPRHLRVRPAVPDADNPGLSSIVLRFELPRGSYATLVVKRLFARSADARSKADSDHYDGMNSALKAAARRGNSGAGRPAYAGRDDGAGQTGDERDSKPRGGYQGDRKREYGGGRSGGERREGAYARRQGGGYGGGGQRGDRDSRGGERTGYGSRPERGGSRGQNDYQSGGRQGGGYSGGQRDRDRGGYGARDSGSRGGSYQGGGYRGRDDSRGGERSGGYRGGNDRGAGYGGGDHRDRNANRSHGGERGGAWGRSGGSNSNSGGYKSGGGYKNSGGSYNSRDREDRGGGGGAWGGGQRSGSGGGYQGRGGDRRSEGGYGDRGQRSSGGYRGNQGGGQRSSGDDRGQRGGGAWGGAERSNSGGGYRGRSDDSRSSDNYGNRGGQQRSSGGYRGGRDDRGGAWGSGHKSSGGYGGKSSGGSGAGSGAWGSSKDKASDSFHGKSFGYKSSSYKSRDGAAGRSGSGGGGWKSSASQGGKSDAGASSYSGDNPWLKAKLNKSKDSAREAGHESKAAPTENGDN